MDRYKFESVRGSFDANLLLRLLGRVRSLLREAEGEVVELVQSVDRLPIEEKHEAASDKVYEVVAVEWVPRPKSSGELIAEIAALLEEVLPLARSTNLPADRAALTPLQRAQLITLLETTLAMIKAPLVEKGLIKKVAEAATSGAVAAVQKQSEFALGFALKKLVDALLKLTGMM